ncbi:MAG: hypothetical protein ACK5V3_11555 [Bdellovibrionales bacterium]
MKITLFILSLLVAFKSPAAFLDASHCQPEKSNEPFLVVQDFKWGYTLVELLEKFVEIYQSDKRLKNRAYWNPEKKALVFPYRSFNGGDFVVPLSFAQNIASHIESGFKHNIIDGVFFPDMGHSHIFIPLDRWHSVYESTPVTKISRFYEGVFQDPQVKFLYHTAEQLKMLDQDQLVEDPRVRFRHQTRNLVGTMDGSGDVFWISNPESPVNTARELPGHYYYGAGFNLSANKKGCFSALVKGREIKFDISMFDLESNQVEYDDQQGM